MRRIHTEYSPLVPNREASGKLCGGLSRGASRIMSYRILSLALEENTLRICSLCQQFSCNTQLVFRGEFSSWKGDSKCCSIETLGLSLIFFFPWLVNEVGSHTCHQILFVIPKA